jgi:hypothetical protein
MYVPYKPTQSLTDVSVNGLKVSSAILGREVKLTSPAVTSRLEDVASSQTAAPTSSARSTDAVAGHSSSSQAPAQAAAAAVPSSSGTKEKEMSPAVQAYQDEILNGALAALVAKSKEIGGIVEQHVSPPSNSSRKKTKTDGIDCTPCSPVSGSA